MLEVYVIDLVKDTITKEDREALAGWILSDPKLTKGDLTVQFEEEWSSWLGTKHSVFVNSGSSANLLMASVLLESGKLRNKKIIVPAVSWATTVAPFIQLGFEPIMCDCDMANLGLDVNHFERLVKEHNPSSVIIVHVLGYPNNMKKIMDTCKKYDIFLLEDCCEAHGCEYDGQKVGTFGCMSSFSFYYGHHMSTIEGGMVSMNSKEFLDLSLMIRSHGWIRDLDEYSKNSCIENYGLDDFEALYSFLVPGYNIRSTDLNAFLGIRQLKRLDETIAARRKILSVYSKNLSEKIWTQSCKLSNPSPLAFGIISAAKDNIVKNLQKDNIACRPLICGSIAEHPFWYMRYGSDNDCENAKSVHKNGLYIPCHQSMTLEETEFICKIILESI